MSRRNARCINQGDLALSQIELGYQYFAIGEREKAQMHLTEAIASLREFGDIDTKDYKQIRHSQLQEQLANLSVQLHQYEQAYQHMKI
jgi:tetratricopeptide (TPR) repeat protein